MTNYHHSYAFILATHMHLLHEKVSGRSHPNLKTLCTITYPSCHALTMHMLKIVVFIKLLDMIQILTDASRLIAWVMLRQVHTIVTCGSQTNSEVTACDENPNLLDHYNIEEHTCSLNGNY